MALVVAVLELNHLIYNDFKVKLISSSRLIFSGVSGLESNRVNNNLLRGERGGLLIHPPTHTNSIPIVVQ